MLRFMLLSLAVMLSAINPAPAVEDDMILIPAGEFTMGGDQRGPDEKPAHKVYLDAYYIGKYEVTNEVYYEFWQATGKHTPESFPDYLWPERALKYPRHPVVGVSWDDAAAYAEWKGMRLPTEAEWEKAARGPTDRLWPWGNALQPYANTWDGGDGYDNAVAPVGGFPNGKSYYGAMDMAGNVWEWTADWYDDAYYFHSPKRNPKGPEAGTWRVIRGGGWTDHINRCGVTFRLQFYPTLKTSFIGFRLAKTATETGKDE